jgi:hypothetical protein
MIQISRIVDTGHALLHHWTQLRMQSGKPQNLLGPSFMRKTTTATLLITEQGYIVYQKAQKKIRQILMPNY